MRFRRAAIEPRSSLFSAALPSETDVARGLSALTGLSAAGLGFEIAVEHYRGSFGDTWMWTPVLLSPLLSGAGFAGARSAVVRRRWLAPLAAAYLADGVIGVVTHIRGVMRRPGGFSEPVYNIVMGPPLLAPGALSLVGGMGVVAGALTQAG
ncbi:MAG: hypothetical protein J2O48_00015 [Solirubrobacterales bacterium]|nr:hypothetical protein [Solirubrobacterales bacterium]